jgi:hypothetical protein
VLNKFFGKKKEEKYFLEIDTTTENKPSEEVAVSEEDSTLERLTIEGKGDAVNSKPQTRVDVSYDLPEWVKAIKNYSNQGNSSNSATEGENFAGKYVSNSVPQSRRRPGPSLEGFKKIASKMGK